MANNFVKIALCRVKITSHAGVKNIQSCYTRRNIYIFPSPTSLSHLDVFVVVFLFVHIKYV